MEEDHQVPDPERERWHYCMRLAVTSLGFGIGLWVFGWLLGDTEGGVVFVGVGQAWVSLSSCCIGVLFFFVPQNES